MVHVSTKAKVYIPAPLKSQLPFEHISLIIYTDVVCKFEGWPPFILASTANQNQTKEDG